MKNKKEEIKIEIPKELTFEEKLKKVQETYGYENRKERLRLNKLLGVKGIIKGLNKSNKTSEYEPIVISKIKENVICKNEECKNIRINGSSRCLECKKNVK